MTEDIQETQDFGYSSKWENYEHPIPQEPVPAIPTDYTGQPVFDYTHTETA